MNAKRMRITGLAIALCVLAVGVTGTSPVRAVDLDTIIWISPAYIGGRIQNLTGEFTSSITSSSQRDFKFYYANGTQITGISNYLDEVTSGHYVLNVPLSLRTYDDGGYYAWVNVSDGTDWDEGTLPFTIEHMFYFIGGPVASWDQTSDMVTIASVPFFTSQDINIIGIDADNIVRAKNVTAAKCKIYNDLGIAIAEKVLNYNSALNQWIGAGIPMTWKGTGNFYAVAEFTLTNGTTVTSPAGAKFQRANQLEDIITWIAVIGGIGAGVILVVLIYLKKHGSKDIARKEKKEKKEIKVLEISDEEIKKAKRGKAPEPKVEAKEEPKGVTKKSGDLIFEVPKWEEGDGEK